MTLFVLFGLPTEVNNGEHFRGVLFDFDWYKRFVAYVIQTWNQNIPDILKLRRMFFIKIDTVSSMTIAGYAWISMGAAAFVFIVFGISRAFGRLKAWPGPAKTAVANFAEYPGHLLFLSVFGGWVVRGRTLAISGPFTTAIGFGAAMVGVGYLAATYLVTKVVNT